MPNLSPKENYLRALRHGEYEYVPVLGGDVARSGLFCPVDRGQASTGFLDGFGVRWVESSSAAGGQIPEPGKFILTDITKWKQQVTIPDVESYDWQKMADEEAAVSNTDRDRFAVGYASTNGIWERIAALMGFEEAMIAMVEEPDAVNGLFTAITDFKIALAKKVRKYFRADTFTNFDDIATERNLFMSPDTYRALIKPQHTRLCKAVAETGMIPIQHTCGHAELCVADYVETGAAAWSTVQPMNDLKVLLDTYGDRFCFEGGFDMNGKPARPDATVDEVVAEVERCFREYGPKRGYIFSGVLVVEAGDQNAAAKTKAILETANRLRHEARK